MAIFSDFRVGIPDWVDRLNDNFRTLSASTEPVEIYVSPHGDDSGDGTYNNPYKTVQHAVNQAYDLHTHNRIDIKLMPGVYTECIVINNMICARLISSTQNANDVKIISDTIKIPDYNNVIGINSSNVTIDSITVEMSPDIIMPDDKIYTVIGCNQSNVILVDCVINGCNKRGRGAGAYSSSLLLHQCEISGFEAGLHASYAGKISAELCTGTDNYYGITVYIGYVLKRSCNIGADIAVRQWNGIELLY